VYGSFERNLVAFSDGASTHNGNCATDYASKNPRAIVVTQNACAVEGTLVVPEQQKEPFRDQVPVFSVA
jgi:hypothetical protein